MEVLEAVSAALDELHFAVEALGDAVVFGKAPHADDLLTPACEGFGKSDQRSKTTVLELPGDAHEQWRQAFAASGGLVALAQQGPKALHLLVDGPGCRMGYEQDHRACVVVWE